MQMSTPIKTKIDVVSGFLGAGKTTFIKRLLDALALSREKIVILENEFGQIGIDGEWVKRNGVPVYEISNGCICCTVKDDFVQTLSDITEKIRPDRILIEPSGIFMLSEIFDILKVPLLSERCKINSITTIIDARHFLKHRKRYTSFFEKQLSYCSTLALSKTRDASADDIHLICSELKKTSPQAYILAKDWDSLSNEDLLLILDGNFQYALEDHKKPCDHENHNSHPVFDWFGTNPTVRFSRNELETLLKAMASPAFGCVLRGKGSVQSYDANLVFNLVDGQYSITEAENFPGSSISFIGHKLNKEKLSELFR